MTYYEELGVDCGASVETIREAYKLLVRLLHPDRLQDEKLRHVAECQMKRLNAVYETLTHLERRRQYDLTLRSHSLASQPSEVDLAPAIGKPTWMSFFSWQKGPAGAWAVAAAIVAVIILFTLVDGTTGVGRAGRSERVERAPGEMLSQRQVTPTSPAGRSTTEQMELQIVQLRRRIEEMRVERNSALGRVGALELSLREVSPRSQAAVMQEPAPSTASLANPPPLASLAVQETHTLAWNLAGTWFYAPRPNVARSKGLYPPEYVEAAITEVGGVLRGRYRARFRVSDRAISPDVAFQFSGKGAPGSASLPWLGAGGARGEVHLKLLSQNTLEIAWVANDLGKTQGLVSGTAVLIRRYDP